MRARYAPSGVERHLAIAFLQIPLVALKGLPPTPFLRTHVEYFASACRVVDAERSEIGLLKPLRESGQKESRPTTGPGE
jgi:hypothetical protein